MKKISFILLALLCWSSMVSAQENNNRLRKKYRNLSFVKQEFEPASYFGMDQTLKSNFGAAFTVGRTAVSRNLTNRIPSKPGWSALPSQKSQKE